MLIRHLVVLSPRPLTICVTRCERRQSVPTHAYELPLGTPGPCRPRLSSPCSRRSTKDRSSRCGKKNQRGYPLHMATDSESLLGDNGLIRKHLLEFVARRVPQDRPPRRVSRAGCGVPSAFTFFQRNRVRRRPSLSFRKSENITVVLSCSQLTGDLSHLRV